MTTPFFTSGQQALCERLTDFICQPSAGLPLTERVFLIKGYAGTGKTFAVCSILDKLLHTDTYSPYIKKEHIRFCAPTNKAKKILSQTVQYPDLYREDQFRTLHQLLKLKRQVNEYGGNNFEPGDQKTALKETSDPKTQFRLVIIDECSMISQKLYQLVISLMHLRPYLKVVFLGDPCQLPPINEPESLCFANHRANIELTEIVRNKGAIQSLCNFTREHQMTPRIIHFAEWSANIKPECENKEGVSFLVDEQLWKDTIFEAFRTIPDTHVLTWTNRRTDELNREVRRYLFPDKFNEPYCEGERLIATDYFRGNWAWKRNEDLVVEPTEHYTCDQFTVVRLKEEEVIFSLQKPATMEPPEIFTLQVYKLYIFEDDNFVEYIYSAAKCKQLYDTIFEKATAIAKERTELFKKFKTKVFKEAAKSAWQQVYNFKETFNPGINYDYSTTVHKSQGSTYKLVFTDLADISRNRDLLYRNQCIYTAFSRASKRLIIYN